MTDFYNLVPSAPKGRFDRVERSYSPADVERLRGSVRIRHTLAEEGANRLWKLIHEEGFINALGAVTPVRTRLVACSPRHHVIGPSHNEGTDIHEHSLFVRQDVLKCFDSRGLPMLVMAGGSSPHSGGSRGSPDSEQSPDDPPTVAERRGGQQWYDRTPLRAASGG